MPPTETIPRSSSVAGWDAKVIGGRLRVLRLAAGLTQSQLGARLGTTQSAVARLEGGHQRLSLPTLQRAADALGCDLRIDLTARRAA